MPEPVYNHIHARVGSHAASPMTTAKQDRHRRLMKLGHAAIDDDDDDDGKHSYHTICVVTVNQEPLLAQSIPSYHYYLRGPAVA